MDISPEGSMHIRKELLNYNIIIEDYGGDVQCVDICAKEGTGVNKLLEAVTLQV